MISWPYVTGDLLLSVYLRPSAEGAAAAGHQLPGRPGQHVSARGGLPRPQGHGHPAAGERHRHHHQERPRSAGGERAEGKVRDGQREGEDGEKPVMVAVSGRERA